MKTEKVSTKKNKRNYVIIALIIILLLLGVGYASFSETLNISGTASGDMTWDVKFIDGSDGEILDNGHKLTVTTELKYPGDQKKITAVIGNNSSVGIKLTKLTVTGPEEGSGIKIDNIPLTSENETIGAGQKCTYEYVVTWDPESTETKVNGEYTFQFEYEQDTKTENLKPFHRNHTSIN